MRRSSTSIPPFLRRGRAFFSAGWILLLAGGCATPGHSPTPAPATGRLEIISTLETDPLEGELGRVRIRIRNGTPGYILLVDFRPAEGPGRIGWQIPRSASVSYDPASDTFLLDRNKPSRGAELFNLALLSPGEEISFRTRLRLLQFPRTFLLHYFRYDLPGLARDVYMPIGEGRYGRLTGEELEARLRPQTETSPASHRMVLFPFAEQVDRRPVTKEIEIGLSLRARSFPLPSALAKLGVAAADSHTFFSRLGLWVIRSGETAWLVSAKRKIALPTLRNDEALFHFLDAGAHSKIEVVFRKETKTLFAGRFALVADPGGNDFLAFVPRERLLPFFELVREFGLSLDVERSPRKGERMVVSR